MKKVKIVFDFLRMNEAQLEAFAMAVFTHMSGNAYFASPTPTMAELYQAMQQYSSALAAAQSRDRLKVIQKNESKINLRSVLVTLGNYVRLIADGSEIIIASSGYHYTDGVKSTTKDVGPVEIFSVEQGKNSGEAIVNLRAPGARFFIVYVAVAGETPLVWEDYSDTKPNFTINGLPPGKTLLFRAKARGIDKMFAETITITKMIL